MMMMMMMMMKYLCSVTHHCITSVYITMFKVAKVENFTEPPWRNVWVRLSKQVDLTWTQYGCLRAMEKSGI